MSDEWIPHGVGMGRGENERKGKRLRSERTRLHSDCSGPSVARLCDRHFQRGAARKAIRRRGRVSLLEVLFSRSCSRQSWLAWEQHKYTAVNISWPRNALNKQRAQFSSESSHTHWRRHVCMRAGRHTPGETHIRTDM